MINIFRKIRKNMLFSKKVSSYLLYAIGEIALVMIGILLALYVNNLNEERKQKNQLNAVLQTIKTDLVADTLLATGIIKFYEENQKNSNKIINREITMDNYKECPQCISLVTIYQPFTIQKKGINLLQNYTNDKGIAKDSLINDITKVYSIFSPVIEKNNDRMEAIVMKNFYEFEKHPWFVDLSQNKISDEMIEYFVLSEDYRTRVASHSMLAVGNHLNATKQYKNNAIELIKQIDSRINEND
ncbi:DUF6090 family protein [Winogradskyella pulchriflava]|uniref:DUF6090 family protein n=1 Tax=Winogradskyella pulchriflava TaxID=1110688 RepID=A0ABV6QAS6_9FLAO